MKSIVTGGAGFLGSHVAEHLVRLGHDVTVIDDLSGGFAFNVPNAARFIQGSILEHGFIDRLFSSYKFDYVFHLAAYAAEGLSHFIKRYNYQNNLIGSVNLINASVNHGVKCFVFTSSIAVYGSQKPPFNEEMTPQPEDSYGIAKYAVEQELRVSHDMFGLDYIIFRPHNVYGPKQNIGDKYRNVVGIFMNQCLKNEPLTIFGDGSQRRAFTYIDDVAPIIASSPQFLEAYGETFNIGSNYRIPVNELASLVSRAMGVDPDVIHLPARNEVLNAYSDHWKLQKFFGEKAETSIGEGLKKMADWVKKHGARETKPFTEIEIRKNLPKSWE